MSEIKIMTWDWKESVDIKDLDEYVYAMSHRGPVRITDIQTDSDFFAIAIYNEGATHQEIMKAYRKALRDDD